MARILVVEDDEIIAGFIDNVLTGNLAQVTLARSAERGWQHLLEDQAYDAILLDRQLPVMDGLTLLRQMKAHESLNKIPVIMETSLNDRDSVREGLDAGAYYYLTKPLDSALLLAVVKSACEQRRDQLELQLHVSEVSQSFQYLDAGVFRFRTLDEAKNLARGLAAACPDPGRSALGLQELLVNAVEHGNLAISYADKTRLMLDDSWRDEVERRLTHPEYGQRRVTVNLERSDSTLAITIQDQGDGFAWQDYLEFSEDRAFDPHGRGIAMSRLTSFDSLEYRGNGNTVIISLSLMTNIQ
jgi:CheY-like chemotaxis protein